MNSMVTVDQALQTIYLNGLSQLELLPEELIWMLLDYAPECVLKMNLSSRMIRCRVTAYAQHEKHAHLVQIVMLHGFLVEREPTDQRERRHSWLTWLGVPAHLSNLFQLRCKFEIEERWSENKYKCRWPRFKYKMGGRNYIRYQVPFSYETRMLRFLRAVTGRKFGLLWMNCEDNRTVLPVFSKFLEKCDIGKLRLGIQKFSTEAADFILETINAKKLEHLTLEVDPDIDIPDPEEFLHKLSSLLLSLQVIQHSYNVAEKETLGRDNTNFLFGLHNRNWPRIIHELLSAKLTKLSLINCYTNFLPTDSVNELRMSLPNLGKKLWFSSSCNYETYEVTDLVNDHQIKVDFPPFLAPLTFEVKHLSRIREKFD